MLFNKEEAGRKSSPWMYNLEIVMLAITILSCIVLVWQIFEPDRSVIILFVGGILLTISLAALISLSMDPDSVRARQSDAMLKLARQTLACMKGGLDAKSAQKICELLMPTTAAIAIAITDKDQILGYAGYDAVNNPSGTPIRTRVTHEVVQEGELRILTSREEIGFPDDSGLINAAIVVPLQAGRNVKGSLKFYYRKAVNISETQKSIAEGFGQLLSTQMAAEELEEQTKLATSMELKALQSQINPHFLFNTINTIASLIRTNPEKARMLLREFAVFYRRTLEDQADLIPFSREMEQTTRYFAFEVARFGEDRVCMEVVADFEVADVMVPPFLIQPLVENAVRHAMPSEGKLTITITADVYDDEIVIGVADDGVGMTEEARQNILHPESSTGLGIAVKNVHDRMVGYFGPGTHMDVESELGKGTKITLHLSREGLDQYMPEV